MKTRNTNNMYDLIMQKFGRYVIRIQSLASHDDLLIKIFKISINLYDKKEKRFVIKDIELKCDLKKLTDRNK